MRIRPLLIAILGLVGLLVVIVPLVVSKFGHAYWFVGVHGPTAPSELTPRSRVKVADFAAGSNHRMAILVTDPDSGWLGLARGLKAHGIPFVMTQDPAVALRHKVVFVYPIISGAALGPDALRGLAQHVHDGGSLLAFDVEGGGLQALFGITGPPTQGLSDTLVLTSGDPRPAAQAIRISRRGTEAELKVLKYQVETGDVAGRFDDGSPGLLCHQAVGVACAIGVDLGALSEKAMNGRLEGAARAYVNAYEPSLDELYRWLAQFYVDGEPMPWLIGTAPPHRDLSILLTHDVDFSLAVDAAI